MSQSFGQGGFVGGSLTGLNSNSCSAATPTSVVPPSATPGTMTSSALAAVTQMSMSNTSNMYNGVDHPHMSSHQGHHHQQQQQQQQLQQPHHAAYMGAQGFFQDRNDLAEASIKGTEQDSNKTLFFSSLLPCSPSKTSRIQNL